jgi:drug/metabolite transporter (DMT)-like permease
MAFSFIKMATGSGSGDSSASALARRLQGQGAVLLCALLWSTGGLLIKLVDWHPVLIAGGRSLIAALCIFVLRLIRVKLRGAPLAKNRLPVLIAGSLAYASSMLCFVSANKLTFSANAILLQYTAPLWAALLGWRLIGEKPRWFHWTALAALMGGLFIFFREGLRGGSLAGDLLALLAGLFYGSYSVFLRMQKEGNPSDSILGAHLICACAALPFAFFFPPQLGLPALRGVLLLGLVQVLSSQILSFGIRRIRAFQALLTAMIEPVLNPLWVFLATGERPSNAAFAGGAIIVLAVALSSLAALRDSRIEEE